jgi:hypothetical protein
LIMKIHNSDMYLWNINMNYFAFVELREHDRQQRFRVIFIRIDLGEFTLIHFMKIASKL